MDISSTTPDWTRETSPRWSWSPSISLLASIRSYQKYKNKGGSISTFLAKYAILRHRFWSVITGADIPINSNIGGGLLLPHPNGVVIHPKSIIGVNCLIFQQVTIGQTNGGVPTIGGHVDIGAGAKILGNINIGDHAVIGANAVVLKDVPAFATAVGVPAQILEKAQK